MRENIYMLPSDMNLNIRSGTVGYNNKILVSDGKFSLGKNEKVNSLEPAAMESHKIFAQTADLEQTSATHRDLEQKPTITHEEEIAALILFLTGAFTRWYLFQ